MKLEYAVPCRGIERLADGTFVVLGAETNAFSLSTFPQSIGAVLLICIAEPHGEDADAQLQIRVLNPVLEPCAAEMAIGFKLTRSPLLPEGWSNRTLVPTQVVFLADQPGSYSIELSVGASSLSVPLVVTEQPSPPAPTDPG